MNLLCKIQYISPSMTFTMSFFSFFFYFILIESNYMSICWEGVRLKGKGPRFKKKNTEEISAFKSSCNSFLF